MGRQARDLELSIGSAQCNAEAASPSVTARSAGLSQIGTTPCPIQGSTGNDTLQSRETRRSTPEGSGDFPAAMTSPWASSVCHSTGSLDRLDAEQDDPQSRPTTVSPPSPITNHCPVSGVFVRDRRLGRIRQGSRLRPLVGGASDDGAEESPKHVATRSSRMAVGHDVAGSPGHQLRRTPAGWWSVTAVGKRLGLHLKGSSREPPAGFSGDRIDDRTVRCSCNHPWVDPRSRGFPPHSRWPPRVGILLAYAVCSMTIRHRLGRSWPANRRGTTGRGCCIQRDPHHWLRRSQPLGEGVHWHR